MNVPLHTQTQQCEPGYARRIKKKKIGMNWKGYLNGLLSICELHIRSTNYWPLNTFEHILFVCPLEIILIVCLSIKSCRSNCSPNYRLFSDQKHIQSDHSLVLNIIFSAECTTMCSCRRCTFSIMLSRHVSTACRCSWCPFFESSTARAQKYNLRVKSIPVIVWSANLDGGVCAGVWWCDEVSPIPAADNPPYNALKSSGVLLHFRFWCDAEDDTFVLLLSKLLIDDADRKSCDNPSNRFSCDVIPIKRLSCNDINLDSWCAECCKLPWARAWSSSRPCCRPSRPPTKFGRRSSISLLWAFELFAPLPHVKLPPPLPPDAEKFNWRLNMAGKMNCSADGLLELKHKFCEPVVDAGPLPDKLPPPPLPARQLFLKSNLVLAKNCCLWDRLRPLSNEAARSVGRYSLKLVREATNESTQQYYFSEKKISTTRFMHVPRVCLSQQHLFNRGTNSGQHNEFRVCFTQWRVFTVYMVPIERGPFGKSFRLNESCINGWWLTNRTISKWVSL